MRRLREWRLLASVLGSIIASASPTSVLAHAIAHDRDRPGAHDHVASVDRHDGPVELTASDQASHHPHQRLDRATRTHTLHLLVGAPVIATGADLDLAPSRRVGDVPAPSVPAPDPPGDDPPRLRAPPLH